MSDGVVKCSATWNDGVVHVEFGVCCDAICEMWLWNIPSDVQWFDTIRHSDVMQNDS